MDVGKIPYHVFPSFGSAVSASQSGHVSLPVTPSSYIYSQFKHVSGVLAPDGVQGVSISKLKILDSLIGEIIRLNKQPKPDFSVQSEDAEKRFNAMVENLQRQIRPVDSSRSVNLYTAASPNSGAIFSVSA